MKVIRKKEFGPVTGWEFGFSHVGKPFMSVHCYWIQGILIDTAQSNMSRELLDSLGNRKIDCVLLTHHHEDHSGNAARLSSERCVPVYIHPSGIGKCISGYPILPYQHLTWGRMIPFQPLPLPEILQGQHDLFRIIHTPGHSRDHCVFLMENEGVLFSGDLYLGDRIKYFRSDERIEEQIASLRSVLTLDFTTLLCAHRPLAENGKDHCARKLQFLEDFRGNVVRGREKGLTTAQIIHDMKIRESWGILLFSCGNVSLRNMVESVGKGAED